ncbi:hypothetical protein [Microbacterium sp. UBA3394]|uniref:hypothetical protein n=1 Tax=Microbacterium sp. UBA3394 TaxID=1946945 RepID=UPI000C3D33C9|nr:hypothetical protein [Microbacterium sp. UBA3394]MAM53393.1 hypothetical protein [Microbacterium sp.]
MNTPTIDQPIKIDSRWEQTTITHSGRKLVRVVEVIGRPTLSSPVNLRIVRNDAHPHREGKTTSLRASVLRANYRAVA